MKPFENVIIIRADCSSMIGLGHVFRCANLFIGLQHPTEFNCHFITIPHEESLETVHEIFKRNNIGHINIIPQGISFGHSREVASWIDSEENDAVQTVKFLKDLRAKWRPNLLRITLILDHYALNIHWEEEVYPFVDLLLVIDDLGRDHCSDYCLQPNWIVKKHELKRGQMLSGTQFSILAPRIRAMKPRVRSLVNKILISMGGYSDPDVVLEISKRILTTSTNISLVIVLGRISAQNIQAFKAKLLNLGYPEHRVTVQGFVDFADIYEDIDICVGAVGTSIYERCYLGIPTIGRPVAVNQMELTEYLVQKGIVKQWRTLADLEKIIIILLTQPDVLKKWSEKCIEAIDGQGVERLSEILFPQNI